MVNEDLARLLAISAAFILCCFLLGIACERVLYWFKKRKAISEKVNAVIRDIEANPSDWACDDSFYGDDLFHRTDGSVRTQIDRGYRPVKRSIIRIKGIGQFYTTRVEHDALVTSLENWRNRQVKLAMTTKVDVSAASAEAVAAWRRVAAASPKELVSQLKAKEDETHDERFA